MTIPFEEVKEEVLKDPEVKAHYVLLEEKYALIEALIKARASAGLTQEEIASRMGMAQSAIARKDIPIQVDAQIMGGTPVIYGTRIPVYIILELLQADYSIKEIVEEIYPHLTYEQICQTLLYITDFFTPGNELLHSIVESREQKLSEVKSNLDIDSRKDVLMMLARLFDF